MGGGKYLGQVPEPHFLNYFPQLSTTCITINQEFLHMNPSLKRFFKKNILPDIAAGISIYFLS